VQKREREERKGSEICVHHDMSREERLGHCLASLSLKEEEEEGRMCVIYVIYYIRGLSLLSSLLDLLLLSLA